MKTIVKHFHGLSGTTETHALDLKVQEHSKQTWEFYASGTGNTIRIKLKSVFVDAAGNEVSNSGSGDTAGIDIQTIDLTNNVLQITTFDFKLHHVRCTYDDQGSGAMNGVLWIKATAAKD